MASFPEDLLVGPLAAPQAINLGRWPQAVAQSAREYLRARLQPVREQAASGHGGVALARRTAKIYDTLLATSFRAAIARRVADGGTDRVALLAVGGYGRGTLGLGSDLDLVILAERGRDHDPTLVEFAETLLYPLWDAGVSVGHAVRTPDEWIGLARDDLPTATTLLDARILGGDPTLAAETMSRSLRAVFDADLGGFIDALSDEMAARHERYGGTVYLLEPDVKLGRGGLRDLDIVRWALRARFRAGDLSDALRLGALHQAECTVLEAAREFDWRLRCQLHARTGRRIDRLAFDEQEEAAVRMGFVDDRVQAEDPVRAMGEATEKLMSLYYRHARAVVTTLDHVLVRCRPGRSSMEPVPRTDRVAEDVVRFDGCLCLSDVDALQRNPALSLKIFELARALDTPLAGSTRDHLAAAAGDPAWCAALRAQPSAGPAFVRLLTHAARTELRLRRRSVHPHDPVTRPHGEAPSVLAELHDLGLLLAMIPEFGPVTGRVQHDVYHVYTVDVHSVAAVDRLHALARGELAADHPLPTHIMAEIDRKELLCLATLLHDVGKSYGGSHHARVGAEMAPEISARLGLTASDGATVAMLVREHLTLYHVATRRDLGDPATLDTLAETLGDPWTLQALYLLTFADLSTTSPTAMTSWKARMLDTLYHKAHGVLADRGGDVSGRLAAVAKHTLDGLSPGEQARVERLLSRMPERYVVATPPEAIVRHARVLGDDDRATAVHLAGVEGDVTGELLEVLVVAPDRPGLLALVAAMLYANRLDVQSAQIYSRGGGALDVFVVRRALADPGELARLAERLPRQLDQLVAGNTDGDELVRSSRGGAMLGRPEPAVRTEVVLRNDVSERATVVEVFGRNRPGLLYAVAREHHRLGLSITLAKVNTEGGRVTDVFYVTDRDGAKVDAGNFETIREGLAKAVTGG